MYDHFFPMFLFKLNSQDNAILKYKINRRTSFYVFMPEGNCP